MTGNRPRRITIVGGGFSGAAFAHHLLRASAEPVIVEIAEARSRLGAGVAYSASEPHQITNIPAPRMSVYPDDRPHFARWLAAQGEAVTDRPDAYPHRAAFGRYMDELVRGTAPGHPDSGLYHRTIHVDAIARTAAGLTVRGRDGVTWAADAVVLATGNPVPQPPAVLAALAGDPRLILDPWRPDAFAAVAPDARVLVLGLSLTMAEAVAGLHAAGHHGAVVAIARRGRRPERGQTEPAPPFGDFDDHRPRTAVALLRHFRAEVRRAEAVGLSWRSVLVAARVHGWAIWADLPPRERRRFVRHLRPFWEALRHVMPGPVYDLVQNEERIGRLHRLAASLRHLAAAPDGLHATLHVRGAAPDDVLRERFDVVVNCTGPAYATLIETDPFWTDLARAGLVRPDNVHLGIAVDGDARALDRTGQAQSDLLVVGTLARGTFGELTGVPELSRLAQHAAARLVSRWRDEQDAGAEPPFRKAV